MYCCTPKALYKKWHWRLNACDWRRLNEALVTVKHLFWISHGSFEKEAVRSCFHTSDILSPEEENTCGRVPLCHDEKHTWRRDTAWNQRLSNEIRLCDSLVCLASLQQNRNEILELHLVTITWRGNQSACFVKPSECIIRVCLQKGSGLLQTWLAFCLFFHKR